MGIQSIDHFELVVKDVARTLEFYKGLGFQVGEAGQGRRRSIIKIGETQQINIVSPEDVQALGRTASPGGSHVCMVWKGTVEEVVEHLAKCGVTPRRGPVQASGSRGLGTSVYFYDPDDNSMEIMVYP